MKYDLGDGVGFDAGIGVLTYIELGGQGGSIHQGLSHCRQSSRYRQACFEGKFDCQSLNPYYAFAKARRQPRSGM
jgi:hypothetical protein